MQTQTSKASWTTRRGLGIAGAVIVLAGLGSAAFWSATHRTKGSKENSKEPMASMSGMASSSTTTPSSKAIDASADPQIDLADDDLQKAQIRTAPVTTGITAAQLRTQGLVKADEYREVHVTALAGGLVKQVPVILGDHVRRGQPLAIIFSSELADAETQYVSYLAELEAEHKKLERTQRLLSLGAASQQEAEDVAAAHAVHEEHVRAVREKLKLLGASDKQIGALRQPEQIDSNLVVPAPIDGVVLMRAANLGLIATTAQELFTVADLSKIWVMASVNEKDFASVQVGSPAKITALAYPGRVWKGRVVYIQPQVDPTTRTAQARIEVANLDERLRIEMYVDVEFSAAGPRTAVVPQSAVQAIGAKQFVFLPVEGSAGSFTLRQVTVGPSANGGSSVVSGLKAGDEVVTDGSFILKAEAVRQHPELH